MKTYSKFLCPNCKTEDNQRIIFLGSEFSYQCYSCSAIHCFVENLYWDFTDNFKKNLWKQNEWTHNLYAGTITKEKLWINDNSPISYMAKIKTAISALAHVNNNEEKHISVIKLSNKISNECYIANAIVNDHFQECFRAIVKMKDHLSIEYSKSTYNILILDKKMTICIDPLSKLDGIDEIWLVNDWDKKQSMWHVSENIHDIQPSIILGNSITKMLDSIDCKTMAISKRKGPCDIGKNGLKQLLYSNRRELRTINNDIISNKYIAVLVHRDSNIRAGFFSEKQIKDICDFIRSHNLQPMVVACTNSEEQICQKISEPVLLAKNLSNQVIFYENFCLGVIGTNCSGCNIPTLYDLPILAFAKKRFFPDDFYCFGKLLSPFDNTKPFNADLYKPDFVTEIRVDPAKPTSILDHIEKAKTWIQNINN
jgi:hypothetical protein